MQDIVVRAGEEFTLTLSSSTATGYTWQTTALPNGIVSLGSVVLTSSRGAPGDASSEVFKFRAERAGRFTLELVLKRQWEADSVARETCEVIVTENTVVGDH